MPTGVDGLLAWNSGVVPNLPAPTNQSEGLMTAHEVAEQRFGLVYTTVEYQDNRVNGLARPYPEGTTVQAIELKGQPLGPHTRSNFKRWRLLHKIR